MPYLLPLVWVMGVLVCFPYILGSAESNGVCLVQSVWNPPFLMYFMQVWTLLGVVILPLSIMVFAYVRMGLAFHQTNQSSVTEQTSENKSNLLRAKKLQKAQKNVFQICVVLVCIFFVCYAYNFSVMFSYYIGAVPSLTAPYYHFSLAAIIFNPVINPYVYTLRYKDFQFHLKLLFYCKKSPS